jgi:AraC-like DNA-binding protein
MRSIQFNTVPSPEILKKDVECFRIIKYNGDEGSSINVSPNGMPGIVFQHMNGRSAIENISMPSRVVSTPTLFLYGLDTEPSVMNYKRGSYATIQVIFKPHALNTLMGINALALDGFAELNEFAAEDLNLRLMEARNENEQVALLTGFLVAKFEQARTRDILIEEGLHLIHKNVSFITVKSLREDLNISERQFERRFSQTVGLSPQSYIRVKRFNEAIRLMKTGQYQRLTDIAYALHFHDQSHFIREVKVFSGMTPKDISQKAENFHEPGGFSYL